MDPADHDVVATWLTMQLGLLTPEQRQRIAEQQSAMDGVEWDRLDSRVLLERMISLVQSQRLQIDFDSTLPPDATWSAPIRREGVLCSDESTADGPVSGQPWGSYGLSDELAGRYVLRSEIGRGGQARVMLALDKHMGREIAWKELVDRNPSLGDSEATTEAPDVQRFLREARITSRLEHPNIVPVYELGRRADGKPYYTMRLVRGETLKNKLKECQSLAERMRLLNPFFDVCKAMAFAHANGVIHRDLKPGNIMVGEFGETVLLDWGLAKVRGGDDPRGGELARRSQLLRETAASETVMGPAIGTPSYMSPEQALGRVADIDERSDVWSLGAVLYEILTGRPPFSSTPVRGSAARQAVIERVINENPQPAQEVCPTSPAELAAVTAKALRRPREERYQNAREMAEDVEAYLTGRRVAAHEYTSWELLRRFASRNRTAMVAAGLVLVVIVGALINVGLAYRKEHRERLRAHYHLAQAFASRAERLIAEKDSLNARVFAAASLVNNPAFEGSPVYDAGFGLQTPESRWVHLKASGLAFQASHSLIPRLARTLRARDAVDNVTFSPDGKLLAVAEATRSVSVWDVGNGREVMQLSTGPGSRVPAVAFSADSRLLATTAGDARIVEVREVKSSQLIRRFSELADRIRSMTYSHDGRHLVLGGRSGKVLVLDADSGKLIARLPPHQGMVMWLAVSSDGRWLATASQDKAVNIYDLRDQSLRHALVGHTERVNGVSFSPDGRTLASVGYDRTVRLWDTGSGRQVAVMNSTDLLFGVAFSPDGRQLATAGPTRTVELWDLGTNRVLTKLAGHDDYVTAVAFAPNGKLLASGSYDHAIRLWEHVEHSAVKRLAHGSFVFRVTHSRDGRLMATSAGKAIWIWESATGKLLRQIVTGIDARVVAFSADRKLLAAAGEGSAVEIREVESGALVRVLPHSRNSYAVAFSPDSLLLASDSGDNAAVIWDVRSGRKLAELRGHTGALAGLDFSPDGLLLATASEDRRIGLWEVGSRKLTATLEGHTDWVSSVVFSSDGRSLFSSGKDALAIQWDVSSRRPVRKYSGHRRWVNQVELSRDMRLAVTASDDGTVVVWGVSSGKPLLQITLEGPAESVSLSPDQEWLAMACGKEVVIYPLKMPAVRDATTLLRETELAAGMRLKGYQLETAAPQ